MKTLYERQIFHRTIDEMKEQSTKAKRDWLQRTKQIIKRGKQRMSTRNNNSTRNILTFFGVVVQNRTAETSTRTSRQSTRGNTHTRIHINVNRNGTEQDIENTETLGRRTRIPNVTLRSEYDPP